MPNVAELIRDHVTLEVECVDRLYLNGYIPTLQNSGQLVYFLTKHRGHPIPSPKLLGDITQGFHEKVKRFARELGVPMVQFAKGQRKDDIAKSYHARFRKPHGVVFIGVAQEKAWAFKATAPNVRIDVACGKKWKAGREREKGSESTTNGRVSQGGGTKVSESGVAVGGGSGAGVGSIELVSLSMEQALW
jgi:hypothetical protein